MIGIVKVTARDPDTARQVREFRAAASEKLAALEARARFDDDAIEAREEALPESVPPGGPPRDEVVGREDEGP